MQNLQPQRKCFEADLLWKTPIARDVRLLREQRFDDLAWNAKENKMIHVWEKDCAGVRDWERVCVCVYA